MSNRNVSTNVVRIPVADPHADQLHLREELLLAIGRFIDGGRYILGPEVAAIESRLAERIGCAGAVGVGCGTDALAIALLAAGVRAGDEVITVSHTAGPTAAAIAMIGAVPVLVDIDPQTYCLDPAQLDLALTSRTRAIVPVHLYGHPAALDRVCAFARRHEVAVVEDCAQAIDAAIGGRHVGAIGDFGAFSFYPTKNLGALGDGGLVSVSHADDVERARRLRTYGWSKAQYVEFEGGVCSRLDELQACVLNLKLDGLAADTERRRSIANAYNQAFADLPITCPVEQPGYRHVYHLYVIRSRERDVLAKYLSEAGVATGLHYPYPIHSQPGLAAKCRIPEPLDVTEKVCSEILTLPLYPSMPAESRDRVIAVICAFYGKV